MSHTRSTRYHIIVAITEIQIKNAVENAWNRQLKTKKKKKLLERLKIVLLGQNGNLTPVFDTFSVFISERTKQTLIVIGPAVFSGGFSTFLAFLLLVNSTSYGFTLFFRVSLNHFCFLA